MVTINRWQLATVASAAIIAMASIRLAGTDTPQKSTAVKEADLRAAIATAPSKSRPTVLTSTTPMVLGGPTDAEVRSALAASFSMGQHSVATETKVQTGKVPKDKSSATTTRTHVESTISVTPPVDKWLRDKVASFIPQTHIESTVKMTITTDKGQNDRLSTVIPKFHVESNFVVIPPSDKWLRDKLAGITSTLHVAPTVFNVNYLDDGAIRRCLSSIAKAQAEKPPAKLPPPQGKKG
jgi:hypothetical protein